MPVPFAIPGIAKTSGSFGLCGGMSAAAADYFHRRRVTSFGRRGLILAKFIKWMVLSGVNKAAIQRRTGDDAVLIHARQQRLGRRLMFSGWLPRWRDSIGFECSQVVRGQASRPVYGMFVVSYQPEISSNRQFGL
ncbi:MAG: hypothetical protein WD535_05160 [Thermaerobacterales bacterium]